MLIRRSPSRSATPTDTVVLPLPRSPLMTTDLLLVIVSFYFKCCLCSKVRQSVMMDVTVRLMLLQAHGPAGRDAGRAWAWPSALDGPVPVGSGWASRCARPGSPVKEARPAPA